MKKIIPFLLIVVTAIHVLATERHMSLNEALAKGYSRKMQTARPPLRPKVIPAHSLPWPVQFLDAKHTIGNSMPEYQNYGSEAYYHEGSDLLVASESQVIAPVDGYLQGDFYTYVTDPNTGQDQKFTKPISEGGDSLYFEITILTAGGYQHEFHHVNPDKLPESIFKIVSNGGGEVKKGSVIGQASVWPTFRFGERYNHIHYNILSPDGYYVNAEYFSTELIDNTAPVIKNIFAVYANIVTEVKNNILKGWPKELIVSSTDLKGENIYQLPPVFIQAEWLVNGQPHQVGWNFTEGMLHPDIREVYARNIRLDDGRRFTTIGNYDETVFLFRLKIPNESSDLITLKVRDSSGNEIQRQLKIQ